MTDLNGKTALITGSTSGIGLGIAHVLAENGANIMLNGLEKDEDVKKIQDDIRAKGVNVSFSAADLTKAEACEALVKDTVKDLGSIDIVINNAGVQHTDLIEDFPPEKWDLIISLMLTAPYHILRHAVPIMKDQGWGRIINIASAHGKVASPKKAAYVAAKHGLTGLTKVVALETANCEITSNAICPGWVYTPLVEKQVQNMADEHNISMDKAKEKLLGEKQPMIEYTTVEGIGHMALYLCSDYAKTVSGAILSIDGCWTAT